MLPGAADEADPPMPFLQQMIGDRPGRIVLVHHHGAFAIGVEQGRDPHARQPALLDHAEDMAVVRKRRREDDARQVAGIEKVADRRPVGIQVFGQ